MKRKVKDKIIPVKEIVKQYLIDNNFDGLTDEEGCSCEVDDLFPCDNVQLYCVPWAENG
jgi:hypothetical protein